MQSKFTDPSFHQQDDKEINIPWFSSEFFRWLFYIIKIITLKIDKLSENIGILTCFKSPNIW